MSTPRKSQESTDTAEQACLCCTSQPRSIPRVSAFYHSTTFLANKSMPEITRTISLSEHTHQTLRNAFRAQVSASNSVFLILLVGFKMFQKPVHFPIISTSHFFLTAQMHPLVFHLNNDFWVLVCIIFFFSQQCYDNTTSINQQESCLGPLGYL